MYSVELYKAGPARPRPPSSKTEKSLALTGQCAQATASYLESADAWARLFQLRNNSSKSGSILRCPVADFYLAVERLSGAILDRLTHHVNILEMNDESYRPKYSKTAKNNA
jgi:hypothetical protein